MKRYHPSRSERIFPNHEHTAQGHTVQRRLVHVSQKYSTAPRSRELAPRRTLMSQQRQWNPVGLLRKMKMYTTALVQKTDTFFVHFCGWFVSYSVSSRTKGAMAADHDSGEKRQLISTMSLRTRFEHRGGIHREPQMHCKRGGSSTQWPLLAENAYALDACSDTCCATGCCRLDVAAVCSALDIVENKSNQSSIECQYFVGQ